MGEGLGHINPKLGNILCREQAFGGNDPVRANTKTGLLAVGHAAQNLLAQRGRAAKKGNNDRNDNKDDNQIEKEKYRIGQFISRSLHPTQKAFGRLFCRGGRRAICHGGLSRIFPT